MSWGLETRILQFCLLLLLTCFLLTVLEIILDLKANLQINGVGVFAGLTPFAVSHQSTEVHWNTHWLAAWLPVLLMMCTLMDLLAISSLLFFFLYKLWTSSLSCVRTAVLPSSTQHFVKDMHHAPLFSCILHPSLIASCVVTLAHFILFCGKQVLTYLITTTAQCLKAVLYKVLSLAVQTRRLFVKVSTISTEYGLLFHLQVIMNLTCESCFKVTSNMCVECWYSLSVCETEHLLPVVTLKILHHIDVVHDVVQWV